MELGTVARTQIFVGDLPVEVVRKNCKNLHIGIYPPDGRVRVVTSPAVSNNAVRIAVATRLDWIKEQQAQFKKDDHETERGYYAGEIHYLFGKPYMLNVIYHTGAGRIEVRDDSNLDMYIREGSDVEQRERVVVEWYRELLHDLVQPLVDKWQEIMGIEIGEWRVRRMKTMWGSCTVEDRRVWINLELTKKPPHCLEYVVAREMSHLLGNESDAENEEQLTMYLDRFLPDWRSCRDDLLEEPVDHKEW